MPKKITFQLKSESRQHSAPGHLKGNTFLILSPAFCFTFNTVLTITFVLLFQLDSHKSVAMSINVVGSHLAEHAASPSRAEAMESRLAAVNGQWDAVCEQATLWQTRLQTALLEVQTQPSMARSRFDILDFRTESSTQQSRSCLSGWTQQQQKCARPNQLICGWSEQLCKRNTISWLSSQGTWLGVNLGLSHSKKLQTNLSCRLTPPPADR